MSIANNGKYRTAALASLLAAAMVGLGFAAVPLYDLFCRVTGFGGTTMRVTEAEAAAINVSEGNLISVRFDSNTAPGMAWSFRPERSRETLSIGARDMMIFVAKNESNVPITGTATFNVTPSQAGPYFSKIQCFCFTEQRLEPGQEVRMPVVYFVDPRILDDPDARNIEEITLSYTFFPVDEARTGR
ncbi:MAG: cytochrome c oxidase assembly protein [Sphingopyxis sp.]|nr:cytochrome c oxidase assembly protein [Sphingopyxis sp.]